MSPFMELEFSSFELIYSMRFCHDLIEMKLDVAAFRDLTQWPRTQLFTIAGAASEKNKDVIEEDTYKTSCFTYASRFKRQEFLGKGPDPGPCHIDLLVRSLGATCPLLNEV